MTSPDLPLSEAPPATARGYAFLLAIFGTAIFVSASLLFAVQPMFTKMVLPRLGGAPAVWSVAIVFFQAALLVGYAYAHVLTRYAAVRMAVVIHVAVMIAAACTLPLAIARGWGRPPAVGEAFWLIGLFAASIGLPFFALSANAPLLQAWFARTGHPSAKDPYFLYAASNVGSFLALLSYPVLIEPYRPARRSVRRVVDRLCCPDRADCGLRGAAVALAGATAGRRQRRHGGSSAADLARRPPPGSRSQRCRPGSWSPSPRTFRSTSRPCRCSGCCRSRSIF